jgi:hypothetical protein
MILIEIMYILLSPLLIYILLQWIMTTDGGFNWYTHIAALILVIYLLIAMISDLIQWLLYLINEQAKKAQKTWKRKLKN